MEKDRYGFEFEYRDRRIVGMSKRLTEEDMDEIDKLTPAKRSKSGAFYVRCGKCGKYMDFINGPDEAADGKWMCRACRVYMREWKAWKQLNNEIAFCDEILSGLDDSEDTEE